jgi:hypothetical protein
VCGGSEAAASWGIDRARVEELDGEVTGPEVVSAVSPKLGVHDGLADDHGGVECCRRDAARWGHAGGVCRGGDHLMGVEGGRGVEEGGRERGSGKVGLGLLLSLDAN